MADAIELASTYISVGISTEGLGKSILSSIKGVASGVGGVGKKAGADFKQGFSTSSSGSTKTAESDLKRLQSAVQTQAKKVRAARDQERDATRKLGIEEAKLEELRTSGKAKTSQLLAAEDRVEKARRAQANRRRTGREGPEQAEGCRARPGEGASPARDPVPAVEGRPGCLRPGGGHVRWEARTPPAHWARSWTPSRTWSSSGARTS